MTPQASTASDLRIALFTESFLPKLDGVVTVLCLLLDHLRSIGAEVIVFAPGKHVESYQGYPVVGMPGLAVPFYPELTAAIPDRRWYDAIVAFKPTLIHVANPVLSGLRGIAFARKLQKPLIMSFHTHIIEMARFYGFGFMTGMLWAFHRHFYHKADLRLATSRRVVADLESHGLGKTGLWRRGVDPQVFSPAYRNEEMRHRLSDGNPDKIILLYVGRVAPEKQIERIAHTLRNVPNTHLAIVGNGPHRAKLESLYKGMPVTFVGYLKGQELSTAYASSDIFVFPSATETFGLVVAEAMAARLPVVTSRVGGIPEIVNSGVNGFIFEPNDDEKMTVYVKELVENPAKRLSIGEAAHASVQNLTWPVIMDELVQTYRQVIQEYHPHNGNSAR